MLWNTILFQNHLKWARQLVSGLFIRAVWKYRSPHSGPCSAPKVKHEYLNAHWICRALISAQSFCIKTWGVIKMCIFGEYFSIRHSANIGRASQRICVTVIKHNCFLNAYVYYVLTIMYPNIFNEVING